MTDERLGSIALVGNPRLIDLAESFLIRIDAKQRQVALDIQIIDFDMDNDFVASNTSFIRTGNNKYIISRDGRASAPVGDLFPPSDSQLRGEGLYLSLMHHSPQAPFVLILWQRTIGLVQIMTLHLNLKTKHFIHSFNLLSPQVQQKS